MSVEYYETHGATFFAATVSVDIEHLRTAFLDLVPEGGRLLDAGCGSGRDALAFLNAGYEVAAFDASPRMASLASELTGLEVEHGTFEEFSAHETFDGIWACASLLHVAAVDLPAVLRRLGLGLRPSGVLYASFKEGQGEREHAGRRFTDLSLTDLKALVTAADLQVCRAWRTDDARPGREGEAWVNVLARG